MPRKTRVKIMDNDNTNIAIIIALLVVAIFFGGWYLFFGQYYTQSQNQNANVTQELPVQ